jgi:hypothetical protein
VHPCRPLWLHTAINMSSCWCEGPTLDAESVQSAEFAHHAICSMPGNLHANPGMVAICTWPSCEAELLDRSTAPAAHSAQHVL